MLNKIISLALFVLLTAYVSAQGNTNLYSLTLTKSQNTYNLSEPRLLTAFNERGNNSDVYFITKDKVLFVTDYFEPGQMDVALFNFFDKSLWRVCNTSESESKPKAYRNDQKYSAIKNLPGQTHLFDYSLENFKTGTRLASRQDKIVDYTWINSDQIAATIKGSANHDLAIINVRTHQKKTVLDNLNPILKSNGQGKVFFLHKLGREIYVKAYDLSTNKSEVLCKTLANVTGFEVLSDGSVLAAHGAKVFIYQEGWELLYNFGLLGIEGIKDIRVNKNRIILETI